MKQRKTIRECGQEAMSFRRTSTGGGKTRAMLLGGLLFGVTLGCISQALYGGSPARGLIEAYCADFEGTLRCMLPVTAGFVAVVWLFAPFTLTRIWIAPTVCLRGMGLGSLLCTVLLAEGARGLCFAALTLAPYAAVNGVIAVYGGEYALGMQKSFRQGHARLTGGLIRHTLKMAAAYEAAAVLSCCCFAAACRGFGRFLQG